MDNLDLVDLLNVDSEDNCDNFVFPKSKYQDPGNVTSIYKQNKYRVLHINIQSVESKFTNFCIMLDELFRCGIVFDFICKKFKYAL